MTRPTRKQLAESYFQIYYELAERCERRSLARLVERLAQLGLSVSLRQLKRYSAEYDWHQRAKNRDAEARQATMADPSSIAEMNTRHAQLRRGLQGMAGTMMRDLIRNPGEATPAQAARAAQIGAQLERAALGDATTREQIALDIWVRLGYFDVVRPGLEALGYRVTEALLRVSDVGAPHRCERLFILAVDDSRMADAASGGQRERRQSSGNGGQSHGGKPAEDDAAGARRARRIFSINAAYRFANDQQAHTYRLISKPAAPRPFTVGGAAITVDVAAPGDPPGAARTRCAS